MLKYSLFVYPEQDPFGVSIFNEHLSCLNYGEFLNDSIIEFYLRYLIVNYYEPREGKTLDSYPKVGYLNSFFYDQLLKACNSAKGVSDPSEIIQSHVGKWTKKMDLFEHDFIFVPINQR